MSALLKALQSLLAAPAQREQPCSSRAGSDDVKVLPDGSAVLVA
ncbi:MAG TPA: hypothetical protein VFO79_03070 [Xanthomonadales bacterium]|nr:hypothetical protein [Xanthomonadales bacterium]